MKLQNPAISGWLKNDGHYLLQRIYYEDTDFSGSVYHANYLKYMERARTDYLRLCGVLQSDLMQQENKAGYVVVKLEIDYKQPATMDNIITIHTRPSQICGARLMLQQTISIEDKMLTSAKVTIACVSHLSGKALRLQDGLKKALRAHLLTAL